MRNHEKRVLLRTWVQLLRLAAVVLFGAVALMMLLGFAPFVKLFRGDGIYSPPMRYVVGAAQLIGLLLLLNRRFAVLGALVLFCVTLYAAAHVVSIGRSPLPLSVLVALTGSLVVIETRRGRGRSGA